MSHPPNNPENFASRITRLVSTVLDQTPSREADLSQNKRPPLPNEKEFSVGSGLARESRRSPLAGEQSRAAETAVPRLRATPVGAPLGANRLKVIYLLTTFPLLSETFVRREVRALSKLNVDLEIHSLWGGETAFEFHRVHLFPKKKIFSLLWWLPYWMVMKPRALARLAKDLCRKMPGSPTDFAATLLGIAFALCHARNIAKSENRPQLIHAGWATMPATAAQLISALIDVPFTFQANAYDIFLDGGDWLLPAKLRDTALVMSSTDFARNELIARGAEPSKAIMVRRGLETFPSPCLSRSPRLPLHLLSIGRLVEKKGFSEQLEILAKLKAAGMSFEARIIGAGPLEDDLLTRVHAFGLEDSVTLLGAQSFTACRQQFQWADVFLFTGKVSENGDRDGLPNVICEAMANGVPVVSTPVSGVPEAIRDGETGILVSSYDAKKWRKALTRLRDDDRFYLRIRDSARIWVHENFDIDINARMLAHCFQFAAKRSDSESPLPQKKVTVIPRITGKKETVIPAKPEKKESVIPA